MNVTFVHHHHSGFAFTANGDLMRA
jgi:hypothetical protein